MKFCLVIPDQVGPRNNLQSQTKAMVEILDRLT